MVGVAGEKLGGFRMLNSFRDFSQGQNGWRLLALILSSSSTKIARSSSLAARDFCSRSV